MLTYVNQLIYIGPVTVANVKHFMQVILFLNIDWL